MCQESVTNAKNGPIISGLPDCRPQETGPPEETKPAAECKQVITSKQHHPDSRAHEA